MTSERHRAPAQFFSIQEVADALRVSTRTVRRWIKKWSLAAHRIGAVLRISEADLKSFLACHRGS